MNNRIIFSNNGVLEDFSVALIKYTGQVKTFTYIAGEDFIYIGSRLPFNHLYFKIVPAVVDPEAEPIVPVDATMTVEYFDGTNWNEVVEVIDETDGYNQEGFVQFTPDKRNGWALRSTNYAGQTVPGLTDIVIYDFYWTRISFDVDLNETILKWVGNLFSDDDDLATEFADLVRPSVLESSKAGKTDWQEQHARASTLLIDDLVSKGVIMGAGQILDWREFTNACICKTAEIIYNGFGNDYKDETIAARKEYNARLSRRYSTIDLNNDAIVDQPERTHETGFFTR